MRFSFVALLCLLIATSVTAAELPRQQPAAGTGPKVHASKSKDITECSKLTTGGGRTALGLGLGGLVGNKIGDSSTGIMVGSAVGGAVGDHLDRQAKCGPDADVESNAAPDAGAKKKKKFGLGSLLGQ